MTDPMIRKCFVQLDANSVRWSSILLKDNLRLRELKLRKSYHCSMSRYATLVIVCSITKIGSKISSAANAHQTFTFGLLLAFSLTARGYSVP
ncbi:hypothetical protein NPIL_675481 [Nephila pilipes]|uniref:Uncharacterized protein n=1 Tax=Nephila pilipes TaxID=299642 RepID=A0A8X6TXX0_NEPPI|nr:hypothetical protein NPIL_675481 [Nephila pilipes]